MTIWSPSSVATIWLPLRRTLTLYSNNSIQASVFHAKHDSQANVIERVALSVVLCMCVGYARNQKSLHNEQSVHSDVADTTDGDSRTELITKGNSERRKVAGISVLFTEKRTL